MHPLIEVYLTKLANLHRLAWEAIADLPPEALDWTPAPDANSINVLIAHLAGTEQYLIGEVVLGRPSGQDREAEFRARGLDHDQLHALLDESLENVSRLLEGISIEQLGQAHYSPRHQREQTAAWGLLHALEHTALHVGHIQLTRQWWQAAQ